MKLDQPHSFSLEEAVARLRALTDYWEKKYGVRTEWQGDTAHIKGKVKGVSFDGTFGVKPTLLAAEVKVGFLAEKLGGKDYVQRKLTEYLDPKNSLEALQSRIG
jgi:hypothetical protein